MRRSQRLIAACVLIALSGALAGCSSVYNWDPSDMLDWLDTKKKLPGERKPVFPGGVPGVEQGVPKELYKGARQEPDQQNAAVVTAPPPEEPKAKRAAKGKKQPATGSTAPAAEPAAAAPDVEAAPVDEGGTDAAPPAPKPKKIVRKRTTAPPPDQPAAAQPGQPAQQSAAPFPAPMPSGTFAR